jgi:hypothetical protein
MEHANRFLLIALVLSIVFICSACGDNSSSNGTIAPPPPTGTGTGTGSGTGSGHGGKVNPSANKPGGTDAAVKKALDKLNGISNWASLSGAAPPQGPVIFTSCCGLALMAGGSTPASGEYAAAVKSAADYVAAHINDPHAGTTGWDQRNWAFTLGGMFLAEAYKGSDDETYKNALNSALQKLAAGQTSNGAYCHGPSAKPCVAGYSELEVMSNLALIAYAGGQASGCDISSNVLTSSISYVESCIQSNGGVSYDTKGAVGHIDVIRTGGALWAFYINGHGSSRTNDMVDYLKSNISKSHLGHGSACLGYLGAALGCIYCGQSTWDEFVSIYFQRIIDHQNADGTFSEFDGDPKSPGDKNRTFFRTGIYALVLQLDLGNLHFLGGKR